MALHQQDWASKWALYSPDKIAVKEYETGRTATYERLNRLGNRLAHYFAHHYGIVKGDRVAVLAENCLEYIYLFVAAQKAGFILTPLNYRLAPAEIDYLLSNAEPALVVVEDKFRELTGESQAYKAIPHCSSLEAITALCAIPAEEKLDAPFPPVILDANDPVFILYTSGTTGFPKGALYTHGMLFWNSINTAMSLIINESSRTVNVMPPFHTGGWNVLATPFLHHGAYTCLVKKFDPGIVMELLAVEKCTLFMGVPTMLKMLADHPDFDRADLSNLLYLIVGGEPMPLPLIEKWHAKGVYVRQGYGMTEVGPNLTSLHQRDAVRRKGSIGRPNFYVETRIIDETGQDVGPGHPGELLLRGPMVTPGYWRNPEATRAAFHDDWFCTGDMVVRDEEEYLFVVDRVKNMFISGGENVYPAEIERVLVQHPAISEAAVIGIPDEKWGEAGKAYLVLRPGATCTEADIRMYCNQQLAKYKIPKSFVFIDTLPKSDTGKINRQALKNKR